MAHVFAEGDVVGDVAIEHVKLFGLGVSRHPELEHLACRVEGLYLLAVVVLVGGALY